MEQPLVSIIIACYNGEKYIDACLKALLKQTYQNIEIIVCDDASKDNSLQMLKSWAEKDRRINVISNDKNLYAAATRNRCLQKSKGEYIAIQDIDDISDVRRIEVLIESIKASKADFISSAVGVFSTTPQHIEHIHRKKKENPTRYSFLWGIPFFHPSTLFSRECLIAMNGYRIAKETRRGQDYDLFMRLYAAGYKGRRIPDILYYYREDAGNIKRRDFDSCIGEYTIRKKGFKALGLMPWAWPCTLKPFLSHLIHPIRYYGKR